MGVAYDFTKDQKVRRWHHQCDDYILGRNALDHRMFQATVAVHLPIPYHRFGHIPRTAIRR